MTINALSGLGGQQLPLSVQNADTKLQAAIANAVSSPADVPQQAGDVTTVSTVSQLQSQNTALKQVSDNLAQAFTLAQVAAKGTSQLQGLYGQLQSLASEAGSPNLNAAGRKQLNQQFSSVLDEADQVAEGASFGGQKLLDGSVSGSHALSFGSLLSSTPAAENSGDLSISDLSSESLLGGQNLNILSESGAQQAFSATGKALDKLGQTHDAIGSFQGLVDYASATVDSALANQDASQAVLPEGVAASSLASLQSNGGAATAAQGNRLDPTLLQLVS